MVTYYAPLTEGENPDIRQLADRQDRGRKVLFLLWDENLC